MYFYVQAPLQLTPSRDSHMCPHTSKPLCSLWLVDCFKVTRPRAIRLLRLQGTFSNSWRRFSFQWLGSGVLWHLMGRGHWCYTTSSYAPVSPLHWRMFCSPNVNRANVEKSWSGIVIDSTGWLGRHKKYRFQGPRHRNLDSEGLERSLGISSD